MAHEQHKKTRNNTMKLKTILIQKRNKNGSHKREIIEKPYKKSTRTYPTTQKSNSHRRNTTQGNTYKEPKPLKSPQIFQQHKTLQHKTVPPGTTGDRFLAPVRVKKHTRQQHSSQQAIPAVL